MFVYLDGRSRKSKKGYKNKRVIFSYAGIILYSGPSCAFIYTGASKWQI